MSKETIFKNTVGRPTNEIKKKRKLFVVGSSIAVVLMVGTLCLLSTKYFGNINKLKGASSSKNIISLGDEVKVATGNDVDEKTREVHSIKMPTYSNDELIVGKEVKFNVIVSPSSDNVEVTSSEPDIISVAYDKRNQNYTLKILKKGKTTIVVKTYAIENNKKVYKSSLANNYTVSNSKDSKTYSMTFESKITGGSSLDGLKTSLITKSCAVKNGKDSCKIKLPIIDMGALPEGDLSLFYWTKDESSTGYVAKKDIYTRNTSEIEINKAENKKKYYANSLITNKAIFHIYGKEIQSECFAHNTKECVIEANKEELKKIRDMYNDNNGRGPSLKGYTKSKTSTRVDYVNSDLKINSYTDYYGILKNPKTVILKLDGNGSDFKTKTINIKILRADGKDKAYTLPKFNFQGSYSMYWCDKKDCSGKKYPVGSKISIDTNTTLYATKYWDGNDKKGIPAMLLQTYNVKSFNIKNAKIEVQNGLNNSEMSRSSLYNDVYKKLGYKQANVKFLFKNPSKVMVVSDKSYPSNGCGALQVSKDGNYSQALINNTCADYSGIIHELAHAWDHSYMVKHGVSAHDTNIFMSYYNKYKKYVEVSGKEKEEISSESELFAASVTNYYWAYVAKKPSKAKYGMVSNISNKKRDDINASFALILNRLLSN